MRTFGGKMRAEYGEKRVHAYLCVWGGSDRRQFRGAPCRCRQRGFRRGARPASRGDQGPWPHPDRGRQEDRRQGTGERPAGRSRAAGRRDLDREGDGPRRTGLERRAAAWPRDGGGVRAERPPVVVRARPRQIATAGARSVAPRSGRRARQGGGLRAHPGRRHHLTQPRRRAGRDRQRTARPQHALGR